MNAHPQSFLPLSELGTQIPPYYPSYDFAPPFIDESHSAIAEYPLADDVLIQIANPATPGQAIPGWLRREDALKLYELAYFADGDILELGSYSGLSTTILAQASHNSPTPKQIVTVDLDPICTQATLNTLKSLALLDQVTAQTVDAVVAVEEFKAAHRQFGFIFIDHSHAYQPVYEVCRELDPIVIPGGFCLFHDFNDPRNPDANNSDFGVYQAVMDGLNRDRFAFYGIYGCTGLYRRQPCQI